MHLFDALDFLAELTQHIPPARVQLIRRYGLYSSRIKGHWTRMPYVLQRAPSGWTSQDDDTAATASNRAASSEVPATETDAPDARERRHAWARPARSGLRNRPTCLPPLRSSVTGDCSDPESRANHKDPEPPGENRSGATGARSDHPRLNRLLGAEPNCRSDCGGGSTQGKVRTPTSAAVFIEPHPAPIRGILTGTRLRQPSLSLLQPTARHRADQLTIPMLLVVLHTRSALDYSSYQCLP